MSCQKRSTIPEGSVCRNMLQKTSQRSQQAMSVSQKVVEGHRRIEEEWHIV